MRFFPAVIALCAVVSCSPEIPDSGAGVGFGDYGAYMRDRERQAARPAGIVPAPQVVSLPPQGASAPLQSAPVQSAAIPSGTIGRAPQPASAQATPAPPAQIQSAELPTRPGTVTTQDFPTIAAGDGAQAGFPAPAQGRVEMVAAAALPERPSDIPNIVDYALGTRQNVGERVWRRSPLTMQNTDRNCRSFVNSDLAQEEFLRRGGPERDPLNLDPDGDGFACWWDPAPFRAAAARAGN